MCGIFGIVNVKGQLIKNKTKNTISSLLDKRGPNYTGCLTYKFSDKNFNLHSATEDLPPNNLFLMHKRLSILDLSNGGNQPMVSKDRRYALIFNGEIYNYRELRNQLLSRGISFHSNSDTEVLLHHLIAKGEKGIADLMGMFAFAFFDNKEKTLLLARDPFGIKPLFIYKSSDTFAFSSQINALLELNQFESRYLDLENYYDFLRFGMSDFNEHTLIENIKHLLPGHSLLIKALDGSLSYQYNKYHERNTSEDNTSLSFPTAKNSLHDLLEESVRMHMASDVPVCFNLSGGIDSSAILALASKHKKDLTAFTYVADDSKFSEEKHADAVAKHLNVNLIKVRIDPNDFASDLDRIIYDQGEPYGGSSIYAQRKVYEAQKKHGFTVSLDGQGGDELFAGYNPFLGNYMIDLIREKKYIPAIKFLSKLAVNNKNNLVSTLLYSTDILLKKHPKFCNFLRTLLGKDIFPYYINKSFFKKLTAYREHKYRNLQDTLWENLTALSIPHLVRYADRNAMAYSIENRVPFLTSKIADFAQSLPNKFLISNRGVTKHVLREAVRDLLPAKIIDRKDKKGFPSTEAAWLLHNKETVSNILNSKKALEIPGINAKAIQKHWSYILKNPNKQNFRSDFVWKPLNLIRWFELYNIKVK